MRKLMNTTRRRHRRRYLLIPVRSCTAQEPAVPPLRRTTSTATLSCDVAERGLQAHRPSAQPCWRRRRRAGPREPCSALVRSAHWQLAASSSAEHRIRRQYRTCGGGETVVRRIRSGHSKVRKQSLECWETITWRRRNKHSNSKVLEEQWSVISHLYSLIIFVTPKNVLPRIIVGITENPHCCRHMGVMGVRWRNTTILDNMLYLDYASPIVASHEWKIWRSGGLGLASIPKELNLIFFHLEVLQSNDHHAWPPLSFTHKLFLLLSRWPVLKCTEGTDQ